MTTTCPACGKHFVVLYPHLWAYKRTDEYYCSWKCLRTLDKEEEEKPIVSKSRLTKDQREKAVRIALDGGDPLRYLAECGSNNPPVSWYAIKQKLLENDPETYEKLPKRVQRKDAKPTESLSDAMAGMKDAADEFFSKCADAGLNLDIPDKTEEIGASIIKSKTVDLMESLEIKNPLKYEDFTVREVEGLFGRYRRSDVHGSIYIDFELTDGADVISLMVEQWRSFRAEQVKAALILGVEL